MTIQQLQDFVNTKPDIRGLINVIVDYIQNNPGGGGATPTLDAVIAAGATLTTDRTVDLGGNQIDFLSGGNTLFQITPGSFNNRFIATDGTGSGKLDLKGNSASEVSCELSANNGVNEVKIFGNAGDNTFEYEAAIHTFNNKVILASPTVPASAAATGTAGEIAWDSDFIYICIAEDTWKRVAIATW